MQTWSIKCLVREATRKRWVVYSKRPFADPEQVLAYLSRYTHRVGISNRQLLELNRQAGTGCAMLILLRVVPPLRRQPPALVDTS